MAIITNSLGSNYSAEDRMLTLKLLFQPWKWMKSSKTEDFKNILGNSLNGSLRNFQLQLFLKGRHAIFEALKETHIGRGDEVIIQAFTCAAVVQPIVELGATPVYVDVKERSINPTMQSMKAVTTNKTKALILQHTLGFVNPETEAIAKWCKSHHIFLIQDLAHAFGAPGLLQKVGPSDSGRSDLNTTYAIVLSSSQDKVIDGVSGGALVIARIPVDTGGSGNLIHTDRHGHKNALAMTDTIKLLLYPFLAHLIRSTYSWKLGKLLHFIVRELDLLPTAIETSNTGQYQPLSPSAMPNVCAALALQQLKHIDEIAVHRENIALIYEKMLDKKFNIVSLDAIKQGSNLRYPIWVENREELEEKLKKHNFYLMDHWYDAVISPPRADAKKLNYKNGSCPNAEELAKHMFNLPTHVNISIEKARELSTLINQFAS